MLQNPEAAPLFLKGRSKEEFDNEVAFCRDISLRYVQQPGNVMQSSMSQRLEGTHNWISERVLATHNAQNHDRHSVGEIYRLRMLWLISYLYSYTLTAWGYYCPVLHSSRASWWCHHRITSQWGMMVPKIAMLIQYRWINNPIQFWIL